VTEGRPSTMMMRLLGCVCLYIVHVLARPPTSSVVLVCNYFSFSFNASFSFDLVLVLPLIVLVLKYYH